MDHITSPVLIRASDAERLSADGAVGAEAPLGWGEGARGGGWQVAPYAW